MSIIKIEWDDIQALRKSNQISFHLARKILYKAAIKAKIAQARSCDDISEILNELADELL